ncbi:ImuA family protein [Yunchengibacter salinarum]|uniref:ImuA family protein n=1 Tax=Yunchengibacter salinarum TaxID=3133399 RepID=UPI0035B612F2
MTASNDNKGQGADGAGAGAGDSAALQRVIDRLEGRGAHLAAGAAGATGFGDPLIDGAVRDGALADGALHELVAPEGNPGAASALVAGLAARIAARRAGPVLWVIPAEAARERGLPYGPGLIQAGLDPARLMLVRPASRRDALWAMEEALGSGAVAAVLGEGVDTGLTESRRLALAARTSGTPALLLCHGAAPSGSVARSRWRIASRPGHVAAAHRPLRPRYGLDLLRARTDRPHGWTVEGPAFAHPGTAPKASHHETVSFPVVSPVADRALAPPPRRHQSG